VTRDSRGPLTPCLIYTIRWNPQAAPTESCAKIDAAGAHLTKTKTMLPSSTHLFPRAGRFEARAWRRTYSFYEDSASHEHRTGLQMLQERRRGDLPSASGKSLVYHGRQTDGETRKRMSVLRWHGVD